MKVYISTAQGAYALLARAVREVWGWQGLPDISRHPGGKPFFPGEPEGHFNLSHSGTLALCALDERPVGADIQIVKTTWRDALPRRVCSPRELAWLEGQPDRYGTFTQLWCLKEARVKYTGTGLATDIRGISVPLPLTGETLYSLDGLYFRIYSGDSWRAAVCGEVPPPETLIRT